VINCLDLLSANYFYYFHVPRGGRWDVERVSWRSIGSFDTKQVIQASFSQRYMFMCIPGVENYNQYDQRYYRTIKIPPMSDKNVPKNRDYTQFKRRQEIPSQKSNWMRISSIMVGS